MADICIDGVLVSAEAAEKGMAMADLLGKTCFVGYEWELIPGDEWGRHRNTDRVLISSSREEMMEKCGSFVWLPPMRRIA